MRIKRISLQIPHIYTSEELSRFFAETDKCSYCSEVPYRHLIMPVFFRLLLSSGLHCSEALMLTVDDMKETGIYEDTPKNKYSNRKIKVSDYVMQMLRKYREWQDYQRENIGSKWIESGKVFTGVTGKPLHPSTPSKWFRNFNLKYGLKTIHLHTLRHTSSTMMLMNGIPLNEISKRLGHNCASTTSNIYCHVIEEAEQKAAEALENAILSKLKRA